jgi:hypothetical protein
MGVVCLPCKDYSYLATQLQNYREREKMNASVHSKTDYPFDYFFEKTSGDTPDLEQCDTIPSKLDGSSSDSDSD